MAKPTFVARLSPVVCLLLVLTACSDFLRVTNQDVIDASTLNPKDAATIDVFARSAQTTFGAAYGELNRFVALFTTEMQYLDTFEPESQFGVRSVSDLNFANTGMWGSVSGARVESDRVLVQLAGPESAAQLNGARSALFAGYSILLMAETFCQGTLANVSANEPGVPLTTQQLLDTAVARFTKAIDVGTAASRVLTGAQLTEAVNFTNAARVGRARANLQRGDKTAALADANSVPTGFTYSMLYVDDASNRFRLSNRLWQYTQTRGQLSVAPAYRALADTRVAFLQPSQQLPSITGSPLFAQQKFPAFNAPMRLASKLEADYIAAEAQYPTTAPMLALITSRRAAGGQPAYSGETTADALLAELFDQRARDFFLEGKRIGDLRRAIDLYKNPALIKYMLPTGSVYFDRTALGVVGQQTCLPLPQSETANNPNFK